MRRIERATAFRRDYDKGKAVPRYRDLDKRLTAVLELLIDDRSLPVRNRDLEIGQAIGIAISGPISCDLFETFA